MALSVALAVVAILNQGCATGPGPQQQGVETPPQHAKRVQVVMYDPTTRPESKNLDIYDTKEPDRPYKVIALLTCEGAPKEEAPMTAAIFYRARKMGADAVLHSDTSFGESGIGVGGRGGFGFLSGTRCVFRARAIVYTDK